MFLVLSLLCAGIGGLVKPSVYIMVIAVTGMEFFRILGKEPKKWWYFLVDLALVLAMMWGIGRYKEHMIEYLGLEYNKEVSASWQHYLMMGLNDETTGGYNSDDAAVFGEFQFEKAEVRNRAELQRAFKRMADKGFLGLPYFYLRKLVMTFNEATFGWGIEVGVFGYYEGGQNLASGTERTDFLRSIYWEGQWTEVYNTVCQVIWYGVLLGLPGICLMKKRNTGYNILLVSVLGVLFYQMLFEARARYLFVFAPVLIAASVCGYEQYVNLIGKFIKKLCFRQKNRRTVL